MGREPEHISGKASLLYCVRADAVLVMWIGWVMLMFGCSKEGRKSTNQSVVERHIGALCNLEVGGMMSFLLYLISHVLGS